MRVLAPAKINLWLRLLNRRDDGYHAIETRMCRLELADVLDIRILEEENSSLELSCNDASLPVNADNLVAKAVEGFRRETFFQKNICIDLTKNIPHGAGLGGGSSDAAATLLALNKELNTPLPLEKLREIASEIGSDVPFFLFESPCDCTGRGEIISPLSEMKKLPVLLLKPSFPVSTPWAYRQFDAIQEKETKQIEAQKASWGIVQNDLEAPVFSKYLYLAELKRWLLEQEETEVALLSGSGSTVFSIALSESKLSDLQKKAEVFFQDPSLWICKTRVL